MGSGSTGVLKVVADSSFADNRLVVNPNDGFDLGLMMTDATVVFQYGSGPGDDPVQKPIYGNLYQKNECRLGTVELSVTASERIGSPRGVRLHIEDGEKYPTVFVEPAG